METEGGEPQEPRSGGPEDLDKMYGPQAETLRQDYDFTLLQENLGNMIREGDLDEKVPVDGLLYIDASGGILRKMGKNYYESCKLDADAHVVPATRSSLQWVHKVGILHFSTAGKGPRMFYNMTPRKKEE